MPVTLYNPSERAVLAFSGKRDVMRSTPTQAQPPASFQQAPARDAFHKTQANASHAHRATAPALKFGSTAFYKGPFDNIKLITDYGVGHTEETSNNEIIDRFNRVLQFTTRSIEAARPTAGFAGLLPGLAHDGPEQVHGLALEPWVNHNTYSVGTLPVNSISDIPGGNTDFASLSLNRLGGAEPNQNIFIHVVDPGVGLTNPQEHDRTILVTQNHGIYIGPNNGSLGMLYTRLSQSGEQPRLFQIDFNKIEQFEQKRLNNPNYKIPVTIHGRDVFAVAAGLIAAGVKPEALAVRDEHGPKFLQPKVNSFARAGHLPPYAGTTQVQAVVDKTFGNLKLNVPYTDAEFSKLLSSDKHLQVQGPNRQWHTVPVRTKFSDVPQGDLLLYHGSSAGVLPGTRNLEIAANLDYASKKLGVSPLQAQPLTIRLVPEDV